MANYSASTYWRLKAVDTSLSTHPTGWIGGQLWSVTAAQWQAMYNAQVSANSSQSTAYAAMVSDRDYWQANANAAWGPSNVWNSGSSWQAMYNSEVNSYNGMVTERDTWVSRANSAWGSSNVWNSGESWQQAYNRVLPPSSVPQQGPSSNALWTSDTEALIANYTADRTGWWSVMVRGHIHGDNSGVGAASYRLVVNGINVDSGTSDAGGSETIDSTIGLGWVGFINSGGGIQLYGTRNGAGNQIWATLTAVFISTQGNPH